MEDETIEPKAEVSSAPPVWSEHHEEDLKNVDQEHAQLRAQRDAYVAHHYKALVDAVADARSPVDLAFDTAPKVSVDRLTQHPSKIIELLKPFLVLEKK